MGVVLKEIYKSYNDRTVLKNLNLEIKQGEFHVLLGPSGGGKTTLLFTVAGLTRQDKGTVMIGGQNVSDVPPEKRRIGFVLQDYALFPHLTVFDNIAYGLRVRKIRESKIKEKVGYYLSKVSMVQEKNKFPHQLSGGQKQRVALSRALVTEPVILLLDEPMSNLDSLTKEKIGDKLKSMQQEMGVTTIYVTHNQEEAFSLGERVSVLHAGKIEQIESPEELFYHPKTEFIARFVGAKNILKVRIIEIKQHDVVAQVNNNGQGQPVKIRVKKYPLFAKGKEITLCIHPEKITLKRENEVPSGHLNCIRGKIVNRIINGKGSKVMLDLGGMELQAVLPKDFFAFKVYENVWVCFAPDAPKPLCGKRCRVSEERRKCVIT